ncbi:hypothetical protein LCGC14_2914280, partial [marine sediment metagenome]
PELTVRLIEGDVRHPLRVVVDSALRTPPTSRVLAAPAHPYARRLIACVPRPGQGARRLTAIPGGPPSVDDLPPGCAFAPRCPRARPDCRQGQIALEPARGRMVRCLYPDHSPLLEVAT